MIRPARRGGLPCDTVRSRKRRDQVRSKQFDYVNETLEVQIVVRLIEERPNEVQKCPEEWELARGPEQRLAADVFRRASLATLDVHPLPSNHYGSGRHDVAGRTDTFVLVVEGARITKGD